MNWPFYVAIAICVVLFSVVVATFATLVPKDSSQNSKLLAIVTVFSFVASVVAYTLAQYTFASNPQQMMQFMLAMVLLICLPASLITTAVSTITISNLRDTLAAQQQ
jgi:hypothetical protein